MDDVPFLCGQLVVAHFMRFKYAAANFNVRIRQLYENWWMKFLDTCTMHLEKYLHLCIILLFNDNEKIYNLKKQNTCRLKLKSVSRYIAIFRIL